MIRYVPIDGGALSLRTISSFAGINRMPGTTLGDAATGTSAQRRRAVSCEWADERNLSSDRAPYFGVRKNRAAATSIDGNSYTSMGGIVAANGNMEHLVLLDRHGCINSNGHSVRLITSTPDAAGTDQGDKIVVDTAATAVSYFGGNTGWHELKLTIDGALQYWEEVGTQHTYPVDFDLSNIGMHWTEPPSQIYSGLTIRIEIYYADGELDGRQLVSMGGYVVLFPDKMWCNAVKLAAGNTMVSGTDYGSLDAAIEYDSPATSTPGTAPEMVFTLCDMDGKAITDATASDTSPDSPDEGDLWIDSSEHALKKYDSSGEWVIIPTTYVKIHATGIGANFKKGDAVTFHENGLGIAWGIWDPQEQEYTQGGLSVYNLFDKTYVLRDCDTNNIVISGIIDVDSLTVDVEPIHGSTDVKLRFSRTSPLMDFVVECGNRLWGCRYGTNNDGETVNEIYASKLGDFRNWKCYDGLSTDSYAASRGTDCAFTGAAVLDGHPLFFREGSVEKVFPSASGAHQILTQTLDGVESGGDRSLCIIDNVLYYKSPRGICAYTGTLPVLVSENLGDEPLTDAVAGRDGKKYYCSMTDSANERLVYVWDTERGLWHVEDGTIDTAVTWNEKLYAVAQGALTAMTGGTDSRGVRWYAESADVGLYDQEHIRIQQVRFNFRLELGASVIVSVSYDGGGWKRKGELHGNRQRSGTLCVFPSRCDRLRIKLEGVGGCEITSMSFKMSGGGDR